ncbi:hypothetical protein ABRY23_12105 [Melioribacteraceae bacterium 4301-Me]|uniref:hypothetical protein n=1 Tax=Pyranulibacter aquaticus TaxID=3163344 RepID=UPI00359B2D2F
MRILFGFKPACIRQVWTALITLLILKFLKEIAKFPWSLSNLIAFLQINLFNKISLNEWLHNPFEPRDKFEPKNLQTNLFLTRGLNLKKEKSVQPSLLLINV